MSIHVKGEVPLPEPPPFESEGGIDSGQLKGTQRSSTSGTGNVSLESQSLQEDSLTTATDEAVAEDSASWESDTPQLSNAGNYNVQTVQANMQGNEWLSSSFITTLTVNLMNIIKTQKDIKRAESLFTIDNMQATWDLAVDLGDMILEKAEKEAEMYRMMAIFSCVALGVAIAGFGIQVGGMGASYRKANIEDGTIPTETNTSKQAVAGGSKTSVSAPGGQKPAPTPQAPEGPSTSATPSPENKGWVKAEPQKGAAQTSQSKPLAETRKSIDADTNLEANPTGEGVSSAQGHQGTVAGVDSKTGRTDSGPRSAQEAQTATGSGSPSTKTKWYNNPKKLELYGGISTSFGTMLAQQAHTIEQIGVNFIQSFYKPEIGKFERDIEILRGKQSLTKQYMDRSSQAFQEAGQSIESVLQFLQKLIDENTRAHSLRG